MDDADRWIIDHPAIGSGPWRIPPVAALRMAELVTARQRHVLARSVRGLAAAALSRPARSASPVNIFTVREAIPELERLARRLDDVARPVAPAGVALTLALLRDGATSPMCEPKAGPALRAALYHALEALEPPSAA